MLRTREDARIYRRLSAYDFEDGIGDLIAEMDEDASSVLASLLSLEMKHLVKQLPGKRVARA